MHEYVVDSRRWTLRWLFDQALPLWWERGADHQDGGFHDSLSSEATAQSRPDRLRVQTRQLYVFSEAGRLGWDGPWLAATRHAARSMERFRRPDGFYSSRLSAPAGDLDLYDQSFVLFALAHLHAAEGGSPRAHLDAVKLVLNLQKSFRCRDGAYWDRLPTSARSSNPLMHLLEAALAWRDLGYQGVFASVVDELSDFALRRLKAGRSRIGENFGENWIPTPECRYEPGHQFEWCYLLHRAGVMRLADLTALYRSGASATDLHGVPFSTDADGHVTDRKQRLWAQTERLRAAAHFYYSPPGSPVIVNAGELEHSISVVRHLLTHPVPGLWYEWQDASGHVVSGPCPATSLYHITTAFSTLAESIGLINLE